MRVDVTKETPAVVPDDAEVSTAAPDAQEEQKPRKPNTLKLLAADNSTALAPWAWMAAADVTAFTAHYATPSLIWSFATAAGASAAVAAGTAWRVRDTRLQRTIKTLKTRRKVQRDAKVAVAAGTLWEVVASTWTPVGPHGGMQLALLGGGLAVAGPHLWRNRRRPNLDGPAEIEAPKVEDARIGQFRDQFCGSGPLRDAYLHDQETIPGGFRFHVELSLAYRGKFRDVKVLEDDIASLYDVPNDHVSVEPPESRSARRAVVTVLTQTKAHEREEAWDGNSTYDPATGTFILGRYADSTPSRWQIHVPYSGACGGISVGVIGSGKTGTLHTVACEAGQATLCAECVAEGTCVECDRRRFCALWMGDPQRQPFGVWRGRADLTAWGPLSCVRMLSWAHAVVRHRADFFGRMPWTDHLGRENHGKGWFDPSPQFPQILVVIDEWPILVSDPEIAAFAVPLVVDILNESRKVGVGVVLGSQEGDVDVLGERGVRENLTAFNTCVHKSDRLARQMLGIEGNPTDLPTGVPGVSYLNGFDRRSGIVQRTKSVREYLRPGEKGVDVRAIAARIAADPITYDESVMKAIVPMGYTGPGQELNDEDDWDLSALLGEVDEPEPTPTPDHPAAPATATRPVSAYDVAAVRRALSLCPDADVYDLMELTGLSALEVPRALDVLIEDGVAVQAPSGRYAPCV